MATFNDPTLEARLEAIRLLSDEEIQDLGTMLFIFSHWVGFLWTICIRVNWVTMTGLQYGLSSILSSLSCHRRDLENYSSAFVWLLTTNRTLLSVLVQEVEKQKNTADRT